MGISLRRRAFNQSIEREKMFAKKNLLNCAALGALCLASSAAVAVDEVRPDEIIVTASPIGRTVEETIIGTSVIDKEELRDQLENTIGETLRREPGISSTWFGPGASRPIIRGLGGDRISVLDGGIGSIDASATSPDHAVSVEPATAERIEIVRGAATLLYGSSAAGGVVNVISGKIPRALPEGGADGAMRIGKSTVDDGVEAVGGFDAKLFDVGAGAIVFHGEGHYRQADDFKVPGFVESERFRVEEDEEALLAGEPLEDHPRDIAENSLFETKGGSAGASYVFDRGFFGLSATAGNTDYGVPGHGHEDEEGGVSIALKQRRLDLNGEIEKDLLLFKKTKLRFGYADYEHREIEPSGEVGTTFTNEGFEGRLEFIDKTAQALGGDLNGAFGVQFKNRDFAAVGEEAFVPPTLSKQFGVFTLKELSWGAWRIEAGGRYERTSHEVEATAERRELDAFSVSGGVGFEPVDGVFFGLSGFRTERAPSTEELFSDGPHLATASFEIGDPTLDEEIGRGAEATARFGNDRIAFSVNGFYTSYKNFIYETATGDIEDDLPVFQFVGDDATFKGLEAEIEAELFKLGRFDVHGDAAFDYVRARADSASGRIDLPRIPPKSGLFGLEAKSSLFDLRGEVEWAGEQRRVGANEAPTDSHTLYNAYLTIRPFTENIALRVAAVNLTNEEARNHASFLKDLLPLPGRNVRISLTGTF
jgi:iron complex outermembrane receptor protein